MKRNTTQEFVAQAKLVHGAVCDYSKSLYVDAKTKVEIICKEHGVSYWQIPNNHLSSKDGGCPLYRFDNTASFIKKAADIYGTEYLYSKVVYVDHKTPVEIVCREHGPFPMSPYDHIFHKRGCPVCKGQVRTFDVFLRRAELKHPGKYTYVAETFITVYTDMDIVCPRHGVFRQKPAYHLEGSTCPKCRRENHRQYMLKDDAWFKGRISEEQTLTTEYLSEYVDYYTPIRMRCQNGHEFSQTPEVHFKDCGCPYCPAAHSTPHKEIEIFLASLGVAYVSNARDVIRPKELDIWIPTAQLALELNGTYWHSVAENDDLGSRMKHRDKFLICQEKGIRLLQLDEHEWVHPVKREIWKSIIASRLGRHERRIAARSTTFREISREDASSFLDANHLQGSTPTAKFCYGLFAGEELVGVITFAGHEKRELSLTRLAFPINTTVVGGASKLLKNALRTLPALRIVTFSNNQYSTGTLYKELGFSKDKDVTPSYKWFYKHRVLNKRRCRHSRLAQLLGDQYDPSLTEHQNMYRAGARCLYDAGYRRWVYER